MKKMVIFLCCLCFLCGCKSEAIITKENAADLSAYGSIREEQHMFKKSSFLEFFRMMEEKETGLFYVGYPDCPWCVEILPILNEVATDKNTIVQTITLYDKDKKKLFEDEEKTKFIRLMEQYLDVNDEGIKTLYVPYVFYIEKGNVKSYHIATVEGHNAHERKMSEEEIKTLKNIYEEMW